MIKLAKIKNVAIGNANTDTLFNSDEFWVVCTERGETFAIWKQDHCFLIDRMDCVSNNHPFIFGTYGSCHYTSTFQEALEYVDWEWQ